MVIVFILGILIIIAALCYIARIRNEIKSMLNKIDRAINANCNLSAFYAIDISTEVNYQKMLMIEEKYLKERYNNFKRLVEILEKSKRPIYRFFMSVEEIEKYVKVFIDFKEAEKEVERVNKEKIMFALFESKAVNA